MRDYEISQIEIILQRLRYFNNCCCFELWIIPLLDKSRGQEIDGIARSKYQKN